MLEGVPGGGIVSEANAREGQDPPYNFPFGVLLEMGTGTAKSSCPTGCVFWRNGGTSGS
jgi:hypothetical protein